MTKSITEKVKEEINEYISLRSIMIYDRFIARLKLEESNVIIDLSKIDKLIATHEVTFNKLSNMSRHFTVQNDRLEHKKKLFYEIKEKYKEK